MNNRLLGVTVCVTMQHVRVSYSTHQEKMFGSFFHTGKLHTTKSKAIGKKKKKKASAVLKHKMTIVTMVQLPL